MECFTLKHGKGEVCQDEQGGVEGIARPWQSWIPPCRRMDEEEQETPQTPSPFHCFSLPRASALEGNPTCGSQVYPRGFIPRGFGHHRWDISHFPPAAGQG